MIRLLIRRSCGWIAGRYSEVAGGERFQRINVACPRKVLEEAMDRIKNVVV